MQLDGLGKYLGLLLSVAMVIIGGSAVSALTSQSPNFEISQPKFGAGAALESCSGEYCAQATIGDIAPGDTVGSPSTAAFGAITVDSEPSLEVIIEPGPSNLGTLSTERTATTSSIIKVKSYLSDGYILQLFGGAPRYEDYTLQALAAPTASTPGSEQFGINLVANTTPQIGADPVQVPSSEFSFGELAPDYAIADYFMYQDGDVVAWSDRESGQTDYTVSMIINVANSTPAGHFVADFSAIVIPAF